MHAQYAVNQALAVILAPIAGPTGPLTHAPPSASLLTIALVTENAVCNNAATISLHVLYSSLLGRRHGAPLSERFQVRAHGERHHAHPSNEGRHNLQRRVSLALAVDQDRSCRGQRALQRLDGGLAGGRHFSSTMSAADTCERHL